MSIFHNLIFDNQIPLLRNSTAGLLLLRGFFAIDTSDEKLK